MPRDHAAAVQAALNVKREALKTYFDEVDRLNDLTKQDYDFQALKRARARAVLARIAYDNAKARNR